MSDIEVDNESHNVVNEKTELTGEFVLWYHSVTNSSWNEDSYENLCVDLPNKCIQTAGDLSKVFSLYNNNVSAGMFFLMRKGIFPMWEDPNNAKGGYWSFKVPKRLANDIWLQLSSVFVGNTLLKNAENSSEITGISVSPKISNCVMKIWNRNKSLGYRNGSSYSKNIFCEDVECLESSTLMYKANR